MNIIQLLMDLGEELNSVEDKEEIIIILYAISLQQYLPVENKPEECDCVQWDDYKLCYTLTRSDTWDRVKEIYRDLCYKWGWLYVDYFDHRNTWSLKLKAYLLRQDWEYERRYPIINSILKYLWEKYKVYHP